MSNASRLGGSRREGDRQQQPSEDDRFEASFGTLSVATSPTSKNRVNCDLLIELGVRLMNRPGRFIDINFFKSFYIDKTIRGVALDRLSMVSILTIDSGQARLMDRGGKIRFYLDFCPPQDGDDALEYLEWIVDLMRNRDEEGRYWLTELHINSTQGINPQKLARILRKLKGITHLSLPFEVNYLDGDDGRKMLKLIKANADSLAVLKHINKLAHIPHALAQKTSMINHALVRNTSLTVKQDFFAIYARGQTCAHMEPIDEGVPMKMNMRWALDVFRFLDRENPLSSVLTHIDVTLREPPDRHATQTLLACFSDMDETLPKLKSVEVRVVLSESDPTADDGGFHDPQRSLVPYSTNKLKSISSTAMEWLQKHHLPFDFTFRVHLTVDYGREEGVDEGMAVQMVEAANETIPHLLDVFRATDVNVKSNGAHEVDIAYCRQLSEAWEVSPLMSFEARITFRLQGYSEVRQDATDAEDEEQQENGNDPVAGDGEKKPSEAEDNDKSVFRDERSFL